MNRILISNAGRFFGLVLIQVLILDNINFGGFLVPYLYVYFILRLPFETRRWLLLFLAFAIGLTMDAFTGSSGIHAAASVLMAFTRPFVIRILSSRREYEPGIFPSIRDLGFRWFLSYSAFLIFVHHCFLFYIEVFRLSGFFITFRRVLLSVLFTLLLVAISEFLFLKPKKN
ncbi:MAG: rod shape-determining protein MreD [Bacteroidales bacterium]|nr:rod shape-determining protein MreD [Bacteroidales bacterium]